MNLLFLRSRSQLLLHNYLIVAQGFLNELYVSIRGGIDLQALHLFEIAFVFSQRSDESFEVVIQVFLYSSILEDSLLLHNLSLSELLLYISERPQLTLQFGFLDE